MQLDPEIGVQSSCGAVDDRDALTFIRLGLHMLSLLEVGSIGKVLQIVFHVQ